METGHAYFLVCSFDRVSLDCLLAETNKAKGSYGTDEDAKRLDSPDRLA